MHENGICASGFFTSKLQHSMICIFFYYYYYEWDENLGSLNGSFPIAD